MDINKRALKAATDAAIKTATKIKQLIMWKQAKSWGELSSKIGINIPPAFTTLPFQWSNISQFCEYWKASVVQRIETEQKIQEQKLLVAPKVPLDLTVKEKFGSVTLFPEQAATKNAIFDAFFKSRTTRAALNDGETGSGKTFLGWGLIATCIAHNIHHNPAIPFVVPYRYLIVTRKVVVESWKRWGEKFGLGDHIGKMIMVTSYSQLTSSFGEIFCKEVYDMYTEETTLQINEVFAPDFIFWDEFHGLNNPNTKQTKFAVQMSLLKKPPYQVFASATPFVTVNNSRTFVLATKTTFLGMPVTIENFPQFAGTFAKRPDKPNIAAAKRLREHLAPYIFSFPKVKWPHKAINQVLIVDFENEEHRKLYHRSYEIFLERKKRAGQNTKFGKFEAWIALGQFRKSVEPYRVPALVDRIMERIESGRAASVAGVAFRETVAQLTFQLHKRGLSRNDMSIIWGGKKEWRKDLLLSDTELDEIVKRAMRGENLEPHELRRLQETIDYRTERVMAAENEKEQVERLKLQRELGLLGTQSAGQRQTEIDKFQSGRSKVCIFTLAAGGVGLSLDHDKPELLPREVDVTPTYSGPEFKQALGRCVRRATLSDTFQWMCYMKGTVEEEHVAPLIDSKLKCIASFTGSNFNIVDLDTCDKHVHKFRTKEEAIKDADNEDAQFTGPDNTEPEDQDEDEE